MRFIFFLVKKENKLNRPYFKPQANTQQNHQKVESAKVRF